MRIDVMADGPAAEEQVRQLLAFHLNGLEGDVAQLRVEVSEQADRRGGRLSSCRLVLHLGGGGRIETDEHQADLAVAVTRALERGARAVRRRRRHGRSTHFG